jgi:hypothetical protein
VHHLQNADSIESVSRIDNVGSSSLTIYLGMESNSVAAQPPSPFGQYVVSVVSRWAFVAALLSRVKAAIR